MALPRISSHYYFFKRYYFGWHCHEKHWKARW